MEGLEDVKKELESKRLELVLELETAQGKVAEIETDLRRVDDALSALTKKKGRKSGSRKPALPTPTVEELRAHLADARARYPFADEAQLEEHVRSSVKKSGASLAGFEALYMEALAVRPVDDSRLLRG